MPLRWLRWTRQRLPPRTCCIDLTRVCSARCNPLLVPVRDFHPGRPWLQKGHEPLRKQLKDAVKAARALPAVRAKTGSPDILPDWELTVGIEIHAQLNASRKLFSRNDQLYVHTFTQANAGQLP